MPALIEPLLKLCDAGARSAPLATSAREGPALALSHPPSLIHQTTYQGRLCRHAFVQIVHSRRHRHARRLVHHHKVWRLGHHAPRPVGPPAGGEALGVAVHAEVGPSRDRVPGVADPPGRGLACLRCGCTRMGVSMRDSSICVRNSGTVQTTAQVSPWACPDCNTQVHARKKVLHRCREARGPGRVPPGSGTDPRTSSHRPAQAAARHSCRPPQSV